MFFRRSINKTSRSIKLRNETREVEKRYQGLAIGQGDWIKQAGLLLSRFKSIYGDKSSRTNSIENRQITMFFRTSRSIKLRNETREVEKHYQGLAIGRDDWIKQAGLLFESV